MIGSSVVIDASMRSISLNGLGPSYRDIALHHLGEPAGVQTALSDDRPFCGERQIERELEKPPATVVCLRYRPVNQGDCSPVAAYAHVPTYVFPGSDLLEVNIAVMSSDVAVAASYIQDSADTAISEIGQLRGGQHEIIRQSKLTSFLQCQDYGYVFVKQNYFQR